MKITSMLLMMMITMMILYIIKIMMMMMMMTIIEGMDCSHVDSQGNAYYEIQWVAHTHQIPAVISRGDSSRYNDLTIHMLL